MAKLKNWDPGIKKRRIIDSAISILNKKEYYRIPVDEIAKKAGVAKGTIYLYFKSKEEIYFSVIFTLIDRAKAMIDEVGSKDISAREQFTLLLDTMTDFLSRNRQIFMSIRQQLEPVKGKFQAELHKKFFEIICSIGLIIEKGIKSREFKNFNPYVVSALVFSTATLIAHRQIAGGREEISITPSLLKDILLNGIGRQK